MALLKALCWALIFIIRIRFPPGTSLATVLNNRHNNEALQALRKFQRLEVKSSEKLNLIWKTMLIVIESTIIILN